MSTTAGDIINLALADLGVIRPGETVSATVSADGLLRLNQMLASLSIEQLMAQTQVNGSYALSIGQSRYTFGPGANFPTTSRPERLIAWQANSGIYTSGGMPLSFADFDQAAQAAQISLVNANSQIANILAPFHQNTVSLITSAAVPIMLAADVAYPLIHVGVYPTPTVAASLELTYWIALTSFASLATVVALPDGWEDMLHFNLAMELLPRYGRQGFDGAAVAANAAATKAKIAALNQSAQSQGVAQ